MPVLSLICLRQNENSSLFPGVKGPNVHLARESDRGGDDGIHCVCFWIGLVTRERWHAHNTNFYTTRHHLYLMYCIIIHGSHNKTHFVVPYRVHGNSCSPGLSGLQVPKFTEAHVSHGPLHLYRIYVYLGERSPAEPSRGGWGEGLVE